MPYFFLAVLTLSFLLLMGVFRSLLVPLKAVIMNLLSIGAVYGPTPSIGLAHPTWSGSSNPVYERGVVMPTLLNAPVTIAAAGKPPKTITEYVGRASTGAQEVSIAWMRSPASWSEPAQTSAFDEYTVVLSGSMTVDHDDGTTEVRAGEAIAVAAGERVRYSTPDRAEYLAICLPAFSPEIVHREDEQ